jgi:hypothetical protein
MLCIRDLDGVTTDIVSARLNHDTEAEGRALFRMEGMIVAAQQQLSFLYDYIEKGMFENALEGEVTIKNLTPPYKKSVRIPLPGDTNLKFGQSVKALIIPIEKEERK